MPSSSLRVLFLGIDVGGTNIKVGLVDDLGHMHAKTSTATKTLGTPERVFRYAVDYAKAQVESLSQDSNGKDIRLAGVGLAVPGVLDTRASVLREVVNLPGWLGEPLQQILSDTAKLPASVVNDANAAAYAEHVSRGLGDRSLALMTLGTGIGCGMVVNGNPHGGDHGCAGELGHITIDFSSDALPCTCGSRGHLESYAGAGGVIARLRDEASSSQSLTVTEATTPRDIARHAESGNEACQKVITQTGEYIGRAIGLLGQTIDPAVVLLGGAMNFGGIETVTGRGFLETIRAAVKQTTLVQVGGNIEVDFASLGNDAGVLGAAMVAKQMAAKQKVVPQTSKA